MSKYVSQSVSQSVCEQVVCLVSVLVTSGTYGRVATHQVNIPQTQISLWFEPVIWKYATQRFNHYPIGAVPIYRVTNIKIRTKKNWYIRMKKSLVTDRMCNCDNQINYSILIVHLIFSSLYRIHRDRESWTIGSEIRGSSRERVGCSHTE